MTGDTGDPWVAGVGSGGVAERRRMLVLVAGPDTRTDGDGTWFVGEGLPPP